MEQADRESLGAVQQWLRRLITEPDGVEAALAADGAEDGAELAALIRADRGLTPVDRLSVYANAYFARLHMCLRDDFPALARAVGPAAFQDLVQTYLMMHPPTRPSLRHAGAHLAEHLAMEPFAAIFTRRCPYAADLARLEWAMIEAFYAEDAPVLAREQLATVVPEGWGSLRFEVVPSLQLLTCAWPVHETRERFDREDTEATWDEVPPLAGATTEIRVWRNEERVRYRAIDRIELEALGAARAGEAFAALCDRLVSEVGEAAASQAAAFVSSWVSDGILARML
jgi:putative DNA-binding protein